MLKSRFVYLTLVIGIGYLLGNMLPYEKVESVAQAKGFSVPERVDPEVEKLSEPYEVIFIPGDIRNYDDLQLKEEKQKIGIRIKYWKKREEVLSNKVNRANAGWESEKIQGMLSTLARHLNGIQEDVKKLDITHENIKILEERYWSLSHEIDDRM